MPENTPNLGAENIFINFVNNYDEISKAISNIFDESKNLLPQNKEAKILIKPDLGNDRIGLSGQTTDLRIIASVLEYLKNAGFTNILIGDRFEENCAKLNINSFKRLCVDKLANKFSASLINFSDSNTYTTDLGISKVEVAKEATDAEFIINIPKLKVNTDILFSCALANMVNVLTLPGKKVIYDNLPVSIFELNQQIKSDLVIIDALIISEKEDLKKTGMLVGCVDPFLADIIAIKLLKGNPLEIEYLAYTLDNGHIELADFGDIKTELTTSIKIEKAQPKRLLFDISKIFYLNRDLYKAGKLLNSSKLQYSLDESNIQGILRDPNLCKSCKTCAKYCPMGIEYEKIGLETKDLRCIDCLYCYFVCPERAILLKGELGFLEEHIDKFGAKIVDLARGK